MSQVLGYQRQMDQRLSSKVSKQLYRRDEPRQGDQAGYEPERRVEQLEDPQMNRVGALERCALFSWYVRVGPKRIKSRQKRMMWASLGIARCSSHDLSILLPTFSVHSAHNASFLEPMLSLSTLLRGPVDRLAVWPKTHSPMVMSPTSLIPRLDFSSEYTPINIAVRRENFNIEDDF